MSLAENRNGKGKKNHTVLANDRSTPAIVRPGEHAPQLDERAHDRPGLRTCALGVT
jgi:hypothetical protein